MKIDLTEYDWSEAMNYARFSADDIADVVAAEEGENEGEYWLLVARLNDGRFGYVRAGCDYTGWDCQAGGDSAIRPTLEDLLRWELTSQDRRRIGMTIPDLDN